MKASKKTVLIMKTIFTTVLVAILLLSCNNQKSTNLEQTEHEKLVKQFYEYFNKHDWEKMAGMYTEVSDFKDPSGMSQI